ncbi:MAG TPA: carboxypeptidase-like regulatory domain-containing protein, partial [Bryobacteraceae bacterium]|nr:carboxypeptidase-like regulatory domain-containing protein [Bryobacteraceae bacterium]
MEKLKNLFLALFCASALFAQSDRGTITGTITDTSGALIPGAKIALINVDTDTRSETVATGTGNYTIPALAAGNYTLRVEHEGFSSYEQTGIRVQVAVTTRVDVILQVGQASQSVSVAAESSLLKTESAEQSTTISGDTINDL